MHRAPQAIAAPDPGSFRDPSGVVYRRDGVLYRQIHHAGRADWEAVAATGLLDCLIEDGLLVGHRQVDPEHALDDRAWTVLAPEPVPFVSYPYEWSVRQLVDAALLTLTLQERAVRVGLTLRDASAYNVQLHAGRARFIDTLSFGPRDEGAPWVAYGQFCRHFLAPLAMYRFCGTVARAMLRTHIDGVPLDEAVRVLPMRSWLQGGLVTHIHLHARATTRYAASAQGGAAPARAPTVSTTGMLGLVDSLRRTVLACDREVRHTEWANYTAHTNYSDAAGRSKIDAVRQGLTTLAVRGPLERVWDLGANTGTFARVAAAHGATVVALDIDEGAVDTHWRALASTEDPPSVLPLVQDLRNPSAALGWAHQERAALADRGPADAILALALVHHLAISNHTPLERIARWFAQLGRGAIVEMVPHGDSQVKRLLATRPGAFPDYTFEGFERAFGQHFQILERHPVADSERVIYVLAAT